MLESEWSEHCRTRPEFVYAELLHQAHVEGLCGIDVALVQAPSEHNGRSALVQAEVRTPQGLFSALGEARDDGSIRGGAIELAELRAKSRALRDALDVPDVPEGMRAVGSGLRDDDADAYDDDIDTRPLWLEPRPRPGAGRFPAAHTASAEVARRIAVLTSRRPYLAVLPGGPR